MAFLLLQSSVSLARHAQVVVVWLEWGDGKPYWPQCSSSQQFDVLWKKKNSEMGQ
jgi:hypothetical protein